MLHDAHTESEGLKTGPYGNTTWSSVADSLPVFHSDFNEALKTLRAFNAIECYECHFQCLLNASSDVLS